MKHDPPSSIPSLTAQAMCCHGVARVLPTSAANALRLLLIVAIVGDVVSFCPALGTPTPSVAAAEHGTIRGEARRSSTAQQAQERWRHLAPLPAVDASLDDTASSAEVAGMSTVNTSSSVDGSRNRSGSSNDCGIAGEGAATASAATATTGVGAATTAAAAAAEAAEAREESGATAAAKQPGSSSSERFDSFAKFLLETQEVICRQAETSDGRASFCSDRWERDGPSEVGTGTRR